MASGPGESAFLPGRRDRLVQGLALATGSLDVIGFTHLGGVFTSVMTGNIALLGLAAGRRDANLALHTGVAFLGYVVGAGLGTALAGRSRPGQPVWPRRVCLALLVELAALVLLAVCWEIAGQAPAGDGQLALLGLGAAAMGIQSAAVARLAVPGLSSTYLTGTLTEVVATLTLRRGWDRTAGRGLVALAALALGAAIGGLLVAGAAWAAPFWSVAVVGTVLVAAIRTGSGNPAGQPQGPEPGEQP